MSNDKPKVDIKSVEQFFEKASKTMDTTDFVDELEKLAALETIFIHGQHKDLSVAIPTGDMLKKIQLVSSGRTDIIPKVLSDLVGEDSISHYTIADFFISALAPTIGHFGLSYVAENRVWYSGPHGVIYSTEDLVIAEFDINVKGKSINFKYIAPPLSVLDFYTIPHDKLIVRNGRSKLYMGDKEIDVRILESDRVSARILAQRISTLLLYYVFPRVTNGDVEFELMDLLPPAVQK